MKVASIYQENRYFSKDTVKIDNVNQLDETFHLMILWGGGDISPAIYGHAPQGRTGPSVPSDRDTLEMNCIDAAQALEIPILGICRGAQMLCAYGGGELFQHVDNHAGGTHMIEDIYGNEVRSNSTHHQQMIPAEHHLVLAWTMEPQAKHRVYAGNRPNMAEFPEVEIIYCPEFTGLAVQGHPEYLGRNEPFSKYVVNLMSEYLQV